MYDRLRTKAFGSAGSSAEGSSLDEAWDSGTPRQGPSESLDGVFSTAAAVLHPDAQSENEPCGAA